MPKLPSNLIRSLARTKVIPKKLNPFRKLRKQEIDSERAKRPKLVVKPTTPIQARARVIDPFSERQKHQIALQRLLGRSTNLSQRGVRKSAAEIKKDQWVEKVFSLANITANDATRRESRGKKPKPFANPKDIEQLRREGAEAGIQPHVINEAIKLIHLIEGDERHIRSSESGAHPKLD